MTSKHMKELIRLSKKNNGLLLPEEVVKAARDPSSPLHNNFDWDDTEAAEKWRLEQARQLIRVSVQVLAGTNETHRVFVSLENDRGKNGYRLLVDVLGDDDLRRRLLDQAFKELKHFQDKYHEIEELIPVFNKIDEVINA